MLVYGFLSVIVAITMFHIMNTVRLGVAARTRQYGALRAIAQKAIARKTGARGLRSICEDLLQQTMFDLPSEEGVTEVVVTEESVAGDEQPRRVIG